MPDYSKGSVSCCSSGKLGEHAEDCSLGKALEALRTEKGYPEMKTTKPKNLPREWLSNGEFYGALVFDRVDGRRVLYQIEKHPDGTWKHVSFSRRDKLPSWEELKEVKNIFFGHDAMVVQILPPESQYVNTHPFCLHLWEYLDGPSWPIQELK